MSNPSDPRGATIAANERRRQLLSTRVSTDSATVPDHRDGEHELRASACRLGAGSGGGRIQSDHLALALAIAELCRVTVSASVLIGLASIGAMFPVRRFPFSPRLSD